mmetsp:Transcript_12619/g.18885  ORF Transcript_12619/g.18885 Transcript_12619/m.18885 type:complete len:231 (-) Transcript_12619:483-1175(-)
MTLTLGKLVLNFSLFSLTSSLTFPSLSPSIGSDPKFRVPAAPLESRGVCASASAAFSAALSAASRRSRFICTTTPSGKFHIHRVHRLGKLQESIASVRDLSPIKMLRIRPNPPCLSTTPAARTPLVESKITVFPCARALEAVSIMERVSGRRLRDLLGSFFKYASQTAAAFAGNIDTRFRYFLRFFFIYFAFENSVLASNVFEFETTASTKFSPDVFFFFNFSISLIDSP